MLGVCTETSETKKGRQRGLWSEMWGWRGVGVGDVTCLVSDLITWP